MDEFRKNALPSDFFEGCFYTKLLYPYLQTLKSERTRKLYEDGIYRVCYFFYKKRGREYSFELLDDADAKEYMDMLKYQMESGKLSHDAFKNRLSSCKSFSLYLQERLRYLADIMDCDYCYPEYASPFQYYYAPLQENLLRRQVCPLSLTQADTVLAAARDYDARLYMIFLLSLRMLMTQDEILSLQVNDMTITQGAGFPATVLSFQKKGSKERIFRRVPADLSDSLMDYVSSQPGPYLFINQKGNPMGRENLSRLLRMFRKAYAFEEYVTCGAFRTLGLLDLVSKNPQEKEAIGEYAALSPRMMEEYGKAASYYESGCIADASSFIILGLR